VYRGEQENVKKRESAWSSVAHMFFFQQNLPQQRHTTAPEARESRPVNDPVEGEGALKTRSWQASLPDWSTQVPPHPRKGNQSPRSFACLRLNAVDRESAHVSVWLCVRYSNEAGDTLCLEVGREGMAGFCLHTQPIIPMQRGTAAIMQP
jgi:hypothetical protein